MTQHGRVLLVDAHSIRPGRPHQFDGRLPDLNPWYRSTAYLRRRRALRETVRHWGESQDGYSFVIITVWQRLHDAPPWLP